MKTTRWMTKSPLRLAETALAAARQALPAILLQARPQGLHPAPALRPARALREFLKQDYRGLEQLLKDWSDLH